MESPFKTTATFQLYKFKADGTVTYSGPEFSNLVLNRVLNGLASGSEFIRHTNNGTYGSVCVGTGNSTPDVEDTGLESQVACTSSTYAGYSTTHKTDVPPIHAEVTATHEFSLGQAEGELKEIGLRGDRGFFNRQLIKDENGDPTTVSVGSDEGLRVAIKIRFYPPLESYESEKTGTFEYQGETISYTMTMHPDVLGNMMGGRTGSFSTVKAVVNGGTVHGSATGRDYVPGSFESVADVHWAPSAIVGTLTGFITEVFSGPVTEFTFDPGIEVSDTEVVDIVVKRVFGRVEE